MACNDIFGNGEGNIIAPPNPTRMFRLSMAEIALYHHPTLQLLRDLCRLVDMAKHLPLDSSRGKKALYTANEIVNVFENESVPEFWTKAQGLADEFFSSVGAPNRFTISAIGHCHIDTAWLWRYRETRRKCARSWSAQIRLMEAHPEYKFACSQMVQLDWLRKDYPKLFEQVKAKVKSGQFIPIGGSWVEMDGNMPSGESFARHFLYGQAFMQEHFGFQSPIFWLPGTKPCGLFLLYVLCRYVWI